MKHMCVCGHDYAEHVNVNVPEDLECFKCDCKEFECEDDQVNGHTNRNKVKSSRIGTNPAG